MLRLLDRGRKRPGAPVTAEDRGTAPATPQLGHGLAAASSFDALSRISIVLTVAFGVILLGVLLTSLADVVLLVFTAVLMAAALRAAAERVGRIVGIAPGLAVTVILLGILAAVMLAAWLRGPVLLAEGGRLGQQIGERVAQVRDRLDEVPWGRDVVHRAGAYLDGVKGHFAGILSGAATGTLGALGSLVVVTVSAIYFAVSPGTYVEGAIRLLPIPWRKRGAEVLAALGHTLRWWFLGQAIDMLVIGALTAAGLFALGIPLWGTLALIAALFNFVPYVGALAGSVPAILVALGQGPTQAISVAVLFLIVQSFEGNVVAPLIQKRTVELPPVITILSQTVLGTLLGPLGLILATPITAVGMMLVRMIYIEDILGDRDPPQDQTGPDGLTPRPPAAVSGRS